MNLNNLTQELLSTLLLAIITGALPIVIKHLMSYIDKKQEESTVNIQNANIKKYVNTAIDLVQSVVLETTQTFVEPLKDLDEWDSATAQEAKDQAVEKVMKLLSTEGAEFIKSIYGDLSMWIETQIEAYLKTLDIEKKNSEQR